MKSNRWLFALGATLALNSAFGSTLKDLGAAPGFVGGHWVNTPSPLNWASLKGKVVVVHFWTLGCINCKHNLPSYNRWQSEFEGQNFAMIGIHTPETDFERSPAELKKAISQWQIRYPVLEDNDSRNWNHWHQQFWPAIYLIDKTGQIRDTWSGELNADGAGGEAKLGAEIKALLKE
jgi:thiol-disulfide isomerase/thioredoxin